MRFTPHTTVATIVEKDKHFLMVREKPEGKTAYNQPAGHLEEGETLLAAALRETLEETAWEVQLTGYMGVTLYRAPSNGITYVRHTFTAQPIKHHPERVLDTGIEAAEWLTYETIIGLGEQLRSPIVRRVLEDYRLGKSYPLEMVQDHI